MATVDHDASPNGAVSHTSVLSLLRSFIVSVLNLPRSLWRVLPFQASPPSPRPLHALSTPPAPSPLASSRPAPPSPAVSRRASGLSRPISAVSSTPSSRPVSAADRTPSTTTRPAASSSTPPRPTDPVLIHIRDYAFTPSDPRFSGHGPHIPRPNRPAVLARRLAPPSDSSPVNDDDDDDYEDIDDADDGDCDQELAETDTAGAERSRYAVFSRVWEDVVDDGTNGWSGLKWGFDRVWAFGRTTTNTTSATTTSSSAGFPSRGDLDRNFRGEDDDQSMDVDQEADLEAYSDDVDDVDIIADNGTDLPLLPGLYRALYAFEPEGTAEMRLEEDQLVRVIGRGGGVGWAVVVKDELKDAGVHALVPESYLEPVRLDEEEEEG